RGEHRGERLRVGEVLVIAVPGHALHPVEVGTGAERWAVAGKHDCANCLVHGEGLKTILKFANQCIVEGVANFRPIERHAGDAGMDLDFQHGSMTTSVFTELAM